MPFHNGITPDKLRQGMNALNALTKTPEGQALLRQLGDSSGQELTRKLSNPDTLRFLNQYFQGATPATLQQTLNQNPQLVSMIESYIKKQNGGDRHGR